MIGHVVLWGGAHIQRLIRVLVSAQSTLSAKPIPRVHHYLKIINTRTTLPLLVLMNTRSDRNTVAVISETLLDADASNVPFLTDTWLRDEHKEIINDLTLPGLNSRNSTDQSNGAVVWEPCIEVH